MRPPNSRYILNSYLRIINKGYSLISYKLLSHATV